MRNRVSRSRIERRLQTLEAVLTDDVSQAVPHTRRWLLYWTEVIGKLMNGELDRSTLPGLIPLEAYRAVCGAVDGGPSHG
jgi:hypothetical protein